jgi:hypothetical protein
VNNWGLPTTSPYHTGGEELSNSISIPYCLKFPALDHANCLWANWGQRHACSEQGHHYCVQSFSLEQFDLQF